MMKLFVLASSLVFLVNKTEFSPVAAFSFVPSPRYALTTYVSSCAKTTTNRCSQYYHLLRRSRRSSSDSSSATSQLFAENNNMDNNDKSPYGNFDYTNYTPEFIDYDNPDYIVDQGEDIGNSETDEEILDQMREERRKRNDEYQFQTYFANMWQNGAEFRGEWTVYGTTTFINENDNNNNNSGGYPRLIKANHVIKVISSASKDLVNPDAKWRGDREVIRHVEYQVTNEAYESTLTSIRDVDTDSGFGRHNDNSITIDDGSTASQPSSISTVAAARTPLDMQYWPKEMKSFDFRGQQGNMCVGAAYTVCDAVKLCSDHLDENTDEGPFSELRSEIGIMDNSLRMRVKFEYGILSSTSSSSSTDNEINSDPTPPLHLKSITVCRERLEEWPCNRRDAQLFTSVGANGGLYDPPPVGCDKQALRYMSIDVEGGASILFPYLIDQSNTAFQSGWVLSLDWTPGSIRYQVDRKFLPGDKIKGLRTLELSEVQAMEADTYRPKDTEHMRQ